MSAHTNLPLSEQYLQAAEAWADADGAADLLEATKTAYLAELMSDLGDMPVSRAEMQVKASPEWRQFIEGMVRARKTATKLKIQMDFLRMRFQEWNSAEANRRAEMKL